ncbi:group III truncated hemoglobin [Zhongshania sp. BJYM1]|uniref:group III truncated hemoglobin n=1 Tax=Zhongshania aquatica TaxID=2965069 RepID=UPI0022B2E831|nr:group III truncated hemoglobin [Marortus sp. BJYM1]
MQPTKTDIASRDDLDILLRHFYGDVLTDPIIGFYFTDVIPFSLESHLPRVIDFWAQLLFKEIRYKGQLFERHQYIHQQAGLSEHHFARWLHLLTSNIDRHFEGPNCATMKARAKRIAHSMATALAQNAPSNTEITGLQFYTPPA